MADIAVLTSLSICPYGIISLFSWEAYRLYQSCDGTRRVRSPKEYGELPALYVEACAVIDDEKSQWASK